MVVLPRFPDLAPTSAIKKIDFKSTIESKTSPIIDSKFQDQFQAIVYGVMTMVALDHGLFGMTTTQVFRKVAA